MSLLCQCQNCGTTNKIPDGYAGKKIKCAKCGTVITVNGQPAAPAVPIGKPVPEPSIAIEASALPKSPVLPTNQAPFVNVGPTSTRTTSTSRKNSKSGKGSDSTMLLVFGGGGVAVVVGAVIAFLALGGSAGAPAKSTGGTKNDGGSVKAKATTGTLVLNWPESERAACKLAIDNVIKTFPGSGPIELQLKPGSHAVAIQRRGFEPATFDVNIVAGESSQQRPEWKSIPQLAFNQPAPAPTITTEPAVRTPAPATVGPNFTPPAQNFLPADAPPTRPYSIDRPDQPIPEPELTAQAPELVQTFLKDADAGEAEYLRRIVQIEGTVIHFANFPKTPGGWLELEGAGRTTFLCHIPIYWAEYAKSLPRFARISVIARGVRKHPSSGQWVISGPCEFIGGEHRRSAGAPPAVASVPPVTAPPALDLGGLLADDFVPESRYVGKTPKYVTTAQEITQLFATKEGIAQERYGDYENLFQITGVITSIDTKNGENSGYIRFTVKGHDDWSAELRMQWQWVKVLEKKKVGEKVTVLALYARKDFEKEKLVWIDGVEFPPK